ncbi:MAG TPA: hypothetical protein VGM05_31775 [Planctomycetaceae bacterium]|jgi:hypothetical protein
MQTADLQKQFSADMTLDLLIEGRRVPLAKIGPGYAVAKSLEDVPAGTEAILLMIVDGREHRWQIVLTDGMVPFDPNFAFEIRRIPESLSLFNPFLS